MRHVEDIKTEAKLQMKLLDTKRLDENNDTVETWVEKRDNHYVFSQLSGGLIKYSHDRVKLTEDEFCGLFSKVWYVETQVGDDYEYETRFHGLFFSEESARQRILKEIEDLCGVSNPAIINHEFLLDGNTLKSLIYTHGEVTFTAFELVVKP